jgi:hypothetical protein
MRSRQRDMNAVREFLRGARVQKFVFGNGDAELLLYFEAQRQRHNRSHPGVVKIFSRADLGAECLPENSQHVFERAAPARCS